MGKPFIIPRFEKFSSKQQQDDVIALFLKAMSVLSSKIRYPAGSVVVIGAGLQKRLDEGRYLP